MLSLVMLNMNEETAKQVAKLWKRYHRYMNSRTKWELADDVYNQIVLLTSIPVQK